MIPKENKPIILPTIAIPHSFFFIASIPPNIGKIQITHPMIAHVLKKLTS
jgi:hypothetical protein